MTFLPIVGRELRVAARRPRTYWSRFATALIVLIGVFGLITTISRSEPAPMVGLITFIFLAQSGVFFCLTGGAVSADAISQERRDDTLGLLFLTDLKGYDIILGKFAGCAMQSIYSVLAVVPIVAVPLMLGGVPVESVVRTAVALVNTLFFSICAGLLVSTFCRNARAAFGGTMILVGVIAVGFPAVAGVLKAYFYEERKVDLPWEYLAPLFVPSPVFACVSVIFPLIPGAPVPFWMRQAFWLSVGVTHLLSWIFLVLAAYRVQRAWQDKPSSVRGLRWRERLKHWCHGDSAERARFRERLLKVNPIFWLASRDRLKPAYVWALLAAVGLFWFWGSLRWGIDVMEVFTAITPVFLQFMFAAWLASEAVFRLAEERRTGALELVLATPLTTDEILRGQRLALLRQFLRPGLVVLAAHLVMIFVVWRFETRVFGDWKQTMLTLSGLTLTFVPVLWSISQVGLWFSLAAKNAQQATGTTIFLCLAPPWVAMGVIAATRALVEWRLPAFFSQNRFLFEPLNHERVWLALWFTFTLANAILLGCWAGRKLRDEFRAAALRSYGVESDHNFWSLLGRRLGEQWRAVFAKKAAV